MPTAARNAAFRIVLAAIACVSAAGNTRAGLVSHRAIYEMTGSGGNVVDLDGRMALEIADVCDGWILYQRTTLRIVNTDGSEVRSLTSFASWESKDGDLFRFEQQSQQNGLTTEKISGRAEIEPGKWGVAYLTLPKVMQIALPPGTLFPTRHTEELIASARAGETHFLRVVFDGSALENPNRVSAFIGAPEKVPESGAGAEAATAWPVRLAFFLLEGQAPEPNVEIGLLLEDNGIAHRVDLDYGNFRVRGELAKLVLLPPRDC
ncbi:MAG: EipB family protein [Alphaproteobacteria bacterium]